MVDGTLRRFELPTSLLIVEGLRLNGRELSESACGGGLPENPSSVAVRTCFAGKSIAIIATKEMLEMVEWATFSSPVVMHGTRSRRHPPLARLATILSADVAGYLHVGCV
jgi:hypothetical protein